uniref:ATP synthase subunit a n=1 Tax=Neuroctenus yunnanensis TaxID=2813420 RepID=A0A8T9VUQ6_9HEMI|nr:ATPase subunit 6 [Neuroctenus yunnanensis]YP_010990154.1 ATP synthase F0 subunit 6 [Neuroctenus taiwanicus]UPI55394.1 ATPase subunit 6 [Neuroctenus yunnanensis]WOW95750.1 ATP synthase F0 subunit 6 [Neuroctenus taiwanicus]
MMTNLFSSFDPATSISFSTNWVSSGMFLMVLPSIFWVMPNQSQMLAKNMFSTLNSEMYMLMMKKSPITLMFISLFMFILYNNIMGLLPYIYTSSSQMTLTITLALPLWMAFMLFGWFNNTNHMFAHLIPMGTPTILMPFMVCIETISNIIRPGSLAVRLTANMIAGHLLMTLLGNNAASASNIAIYAILAIQLGLMWFETAVSLIQAYVFTILSTLYSSEVT